MKGNETMNIYKLKNFTINLSDFSFMEKIDFGKDEYKVTIHMKASVYKIEVKLNHKEIEHIENALIQNERKQKHE